MGPPTDIAEAVLAVVCCLSPVTCELSLIHNYFPSTPIEINHFPMRSVCTSLKYLTVTNSMPRQISVD